MNEKRSGRQSAKAAEQTKREILQNAAELFCEKGFANVSLRTISDRAGVSHSLLRHHFGSKLNIWQQISDAMHLRFETYTKQLVDDLDKTLPSNQRLFWLMIRLLANMVQDPRLIQLVADAMQQEQELVDYFLNDKNSIDGVVSELLQKCEKDGFKIQLNIDEIKWMTISFAQASASLRPLLRDVYSKGTSPDSDLLLHWRLYAKLLASKLDIDPDLIPTITDLQQLNPLQTSDNLWDLRQN